MDPWGPQGRHILTMGMHWAHLHMWVCMHVFAGHFDEEPFQKQCIVQGFEGFSCQKLPQFILLQRMGCAVAGAGHTPRLPQGKAGHRGKAMHIQGSWGLSEGSQQAISV